VVVLVCFAPPRAWALPVVFATAALGAGTAACLTRGLRLGWLHASSLGLIAGLCAIDAASERAIEVLVVARSARAHESERVGSRGLRDRNESHQFS
jgi:hypothetical protein